MVGTIVATLPLGLGIALNPIAIVASVLVARTADARRNGLVFVIGWMAGLVLLVVVPTLIIRDFADTLHNLKSDLPDIIWIVLGVLLIAAAALKLRNQSRAGPQPPRWMNVLTGGSALRTLGIGAFLSTVSLKNLALLAAAVTMMGQATLGVVELTLTLAIFIAISSLGILMPPLVRHFGGPKAEARLEAGSEWLGRQVGPITAVAMALLGTYLVWRGLAGVI